MSRSIQESLKYTTKLCKYLLTLIIILGVSVLLFYFDTLPFYSSFNFFNSTISTSKSFNLALNNTIDSTLPTLCIATRIYWAQIKYFPVLALGLYHSGPQNIRIYLINTDNQTNIQHLQQTINFINQLVLRPDFVILLDLGPSTRKDDFGFELTDRAIGYLYKQHLNSSRTCDYVTFTNGDNFYSKNFVKKLLPHMKAKKEIIAWGFVSHHYKGRYREYIDRRKKTIPEIVDDGTEKCTPIELKNGLADLGAVAYRLSFLQKHNLYFRRPDGSYSYITDGYFVDQAARRTNASIIMRQTLFLHQ